MTDFRLIRIDEFLARWGEVKPLLEPAIAEGNGEIELDDVRRLVIGGRMFVFCLEEDACATFALTCELVMYPRKTVLLCGYGGGAGASDHRDLIIERLREFAARAGATAIQCYCKSGAVARLNRILFGAKPLYTLMECAA